MTLLDTLEVTLKEILGPGHKVCRHSTMSNTHWASCVINLCCYVDFRDNIVSVSHIYNPGFRRFLLADPNAFEKIRTAILEILENHERV